MPGHRDDLPVFQGLVNVRNRAVNATPSKLAA